MARRRTRRASGYFRLTWIRLAALAACLCWPLMAGDGAKQVLVLFGEWRTLPINVFVEQQLQAALDPRGTGEVEFYWEALDEERLTNRQQYENFAASLQHKYSGRKFDLIFATMPASVRFLEEYGPRLFGATPVVFSIVNRDALGPELPKNMTGVPVEFHSGPTLRLMLDLHPRTRRIVLLVGTSSLGEHWLQEAKKEFAAVAGRARIDVVNVISLDDAVRYVAELPRDSLAYFLLVIRTADGRFVAPRTVLASLSAAASVPVYVSDDRFVGQGAVGGYVIDNQAAVMASIRMASRLLAGATLSDLPPETIPSRFKFDARQLKRWNIAESRLPAEAEIMYRSPSAWQAYRVQILAAAGFILFESALILVLVIERKRRAALQSRIGEQLREMRNLSARLLTAHEDERSRIARELHDDVKQRVALIGLGLSHLKRAATTDDEKRRLLDLSASANELAATLSRLSRGLHPAALEHATLESAIRSLCRECADLTRIPVDFTVGGAPLPEPAADLKLCFYRIAQEALQNVARHSRATAASVRLNGDGAQLELAVEDNGVGFDAASSNSSTGLGLLSMRERLGIFGGKLGIETRPGNGVRVVATIPIPQPLAETPADSGAAARG